MSEELVVALCSPTLAGLKTGSLFVCPLEEAGDLRESIRWMNRRFSRRGMRMLPMKRLRRGILVYLYRPGMLEKDLGNAMAREILAARAYPVEHPELCVGELIRRLRQARGFPHEIGLFLGYPPEDVQGFMTQGGRKAKLTGAWQVYENEEQAKLTFAKYKKCTKTLCRAYHQYHSLDRLVVSSS